MNDSKSLRRFIAEHLKSVPRSGIRDFFEIVETRDDVISLSIGEPDFVTPWHIREASIFALDRGATSYTANLGQLELRRATADYVRKAFGLSYNPANEILITVGVSEALDLAIRAIVNPGDEVIYHEPSYVSYAPVIRFAHGTPIPVATTVDTGFQLSADMLARHVTDRTKALLLNFPTNPTGAILSVDNARELAEFAAKHDLVVISDEVYSELTYEGDIRAVWEDGSREELAAVAEERAGVLEDVVQVVAGDKDKLACPLALTRSQVLCTCGTFDSSAIHEIPVSLRTVDAESGVVVVPGMSEYVQRAFEEGALFSEMGIDWARPGEIIDLEGYDYFPTYQRQLGL